MQPCLCHAFLHSFPSTFSFSPPLHSNKNVYPVRTHSTHCLLSIYGMLVNKASQVDMLTDGKLETGRGENSFISTFMAKQADEQMKVEER